MQITAANFHLLEQLCHGITGTQARLKHQLKLCPCLGRHRPREWDPWSSGIWAEDSSVCVIISFDPLSDIHEISWNSYISQIQFSLFSIQYPLNTKNKATEEKHVSYLLGHKAVSRRVTHDASSCGHMCYASSKYLRTHTCPTWWKSGNFIKHRGIHCSIHLKMEFPYYTYIYMFPL